VGGKATRHGPALSRDQRLWDAVKYACVKKEQHMNFVRLQKLMASAVRRSPDDQEDLRCASAATLALTEFSRMPGMGISMVNAKGGTETGPISQRFVHLDVETYRQKTQSADVLISLTRSKLANKWQVNPGLCAAAQFPDRRSRKVGRRQVTC
jgi:hypothetical protein